MTNDRGVFVFSSWKECLQKATEPTQYEQKYGIKILKINSILDNHHYKVFELLKSDNSKTLLVLLNKAVNKELWINWIPTENQYKLIEKLPDIIKEIEEYNKTHRNQKAN